jgi:hypothetical protein
VIPPPPDPPQVCLSGNCNWTGRGLQLESKFLKTRLFVLSVNKNEPTQQWPHQGLCIAIHASLNMSNTTTRIQSHACQWSWTKFDGFMINKSVQQ